MKNAQLFEVMPFTLDLEFRHLVQKIFPFNQVLLLFFLLLTHLVFCQESNSNKVDSLLQVLEIAKTSEDKIQSYADLFNELKKINDPKLLSYCKEVIAYAEKENLPKGIALGRLYMGMTKLAEGNAKGAVNDFEMAREKYKEAKAYENVIIAINNMGICYERMGEPEMVRKSYDEALAIAEEVGDDKLLVQA